ncbi:hypothetical protein DEJ48_26515 [Streptomyces venezuelae]|uniref:Uncharacterized protein n=1 Tax=Streptomyces venezuelae TaxID=54571 RepID=A0A5P2C6Y8_STRVZ|nr:hypothetical protein DEJ48_26515 [Streptomyces venezuelae]
MKADGKQHAVACIEQAEDTVKELRAALARVGITLPTLRMDPASIARETPCPRIELGGCSIDTSARLAAVLRSAP